MSGMKELYRAYRSAERKVRCCEVELYRASEEEKEEAWRRYVEAWEEKVKAGARVIGGGGEV